MMHWHVGFSQIDNILNNSGKDVALFLSGDIT
jgi:hypothetical protein